MNDLHSEMKRLELVMHKYNLKPIMLKGETEPAARTIFCHVLASKFPSVKQPSQNGVRVYSERNQVADFLNYTDGNAVKAKFRDGHLDSVIKYKDYGKKYKYIKEEFNETILHKLLLEANKRCEAANKHFEYINSLILG